MTTVYVCYDTTDEPIYVGCTDNFTGGTLARPRVHSRGTPWWPEVARIETTEWPHKAAGRVEEARLIRHLRPRHNVLHNPDAPSTYQPPFKPPALNAKPPDWPNEHAESPWTPPSAEPVRLDVAA